MRDTRLSIATGQALELALVLDQPRDRAMVEHACALQGGGAHHRQHHAGIIELTIPVTDAPAQPFIIQSGHSGMNIGGTIIETTPPTVLPVEKAVPQVKAGH